MIADCERVTLMLVAAVLLSVGGAAQADRVLYQETQTLRAEAPGLLVSHWHDWSGIWTPDGKMSLHFTPDTPFGVAETVSVLEFSSKPDQPARRVSSPPLTDLSISADGRYVIGLSSIKVGNVAQLAVWSSSAELLAWRTITSRLYCLDQAEMERLRAHSPDDFSTLLRWRDQSGVPVGWREGDRIYLQRSPFWPSLTDSLRTRLSEHACPNPASAAISESVTNWVNWYADDDPQPSVLERDGQPIALRLRDRSGEMIEIDLFPQWLTAADLQ